jgi:hypothetical protein
MVKAMETRQVLYASLIEKMATPHWATAAGTLVGSFPHILLGKLRCCILSPHPHNATHAGTKPNHPTTTFVALKEDTPAISLSL